MLQLDFGIDQLLLVGEGRQTWQVLAFQEFQGRSASGGNVRHARSVSREFGSRGRISTSDDGQHAGRLSHVSHGSGNGKGSLGVAFHLEYAHGSIPQACFAFLNGRSVCFNRLGANVESHVSVRNVHAVRGKWRVRGGEFGVAKICEMS